MTIPPRSPTKYASLSKGVGAGETKRLLESKSQRLERIGVTSSSRDSEGRKSSITTIQSLAPRAKGAAEETKEGGTETNSVLASLRISSNHNPLKASISSASTSLPPLSVVSDSDVSILGRMTEESENDASMPEHNNLLPQGASILQDNAGGHNKDETKEIADHSEAASIPPPSPESMKKVEDAFPATEPLPKLQESTKSEEVLSTSAPPSPVKIRTRSIDIDLLEADASDLFHQSTQGHQRQRMSAPPRSGDDNHQKPTSPTIKGIKTKKSGSRSPKRKASNHKKSSSRSPHSSMSPARSSPKRTDSNRERDRSTSWSRENSKSPKRTESNRERDRSTSWSRENQNKSTSGRGRASSRRTESARGRSTSRTPVGRTESTSKSKRAASVSVQRTSSNNNTRGRSCTAKTRSNSFSMGMDSSQGRSTSLGATSERLRSSSLSPNKEGSPSKKSMSQSGASHTRLRDFNKEEFENYVESYFKNNTDMGESDARLVLEDFVVQKKIQATTTTSGSDNQRKPRGRTSSTPRRSRSGRSGGTQTAGGLGLKRCQSRSLSPERTRRITGLDHSATSRVRSAGMCQSSCGGLSVRRQQASEGDLLMARGRGRTTNTDRSSNKNFSYSTANKKAIATARKEGYTRRRERHEQRRANDRAALENFMTVKAEEDAKEALAAEKEEGKAQEDSELDLFAELAEKRGANESKSAAFRMSKIGKSVVKGTAKVTHKTAKTVGLKAVVRQTQKTARIVGKNTVGRTTKMLNSQLSNKQKEDGKEKPEDDMPGKYGALPDLESIDGADGVAITA